jgi:3',5'-cyclic AMP phosphodiesterase CpdA
MPIYLPPLSRRRFLVSAAAAGALLPSAALAAEEAADANRWIMMADTHVWEFRDREHAKTKTNPTANFVEAVRQVLALRPRPAGLIIAGDTAHMQGNPADYDVLAAELKPLRIAGIAVHLVLGNHDHREHFYAAFPDAKPANAAVADKHVAAVATPHADWLLLDSLDQTNVTPGVLGREQMAWLGKQLDARPARPAICVAHHNPDVGASKINGLSDTKDFLAALATRKQAKAFVFGHTHRWGTGERDGLRLINLPPTAWLFDPAAPRGWVDVRFSAEGAVFTLNTLDGKHAEDGAKAEVKFAA